MTADQLRMARALLRLSITELAEIAGVDKMVIVRMEAGRRAQPTTIAKLRAALDAKGVAFLGPIEPFTEATVAMRFGTKAPDATDETVENDGSDPTIDAMRGYWADGQRWNRLSSSGQKAIARALDTKLS